MSDLRGMMVRLPAGTHQMLRRRALHETERSGTRVSMADLIRRYVDAGLAADLAAATSDPEKIMEGLRG